MKFSRFVRGMLAAGVTAVSVLAASGAQAADLLDTVKERGTLIVGLEGTYPPFNYRSEEHTSELQSLMRISYAVFCLIKKTNIKLNASTTLTKQHQCTD